jgi:hypothetical protein
MGVGAGWLDPGPAGRLAGPHAWRLIQPGGTFSIAAIATKPPSAAFLAGHRPLRPRHPEPPAARRPRDRTCWRFWRPRPWARWPARCIGTGSAYHRRPKSTRASMRTVDAVMAIPSLLLALLIVSTLLGKSSDQRGARDRDRRLRAGHGAHHALGGAFAVRKQDYVNAAVARGEGAALHRAARDAAQRDRADRRRDDDPGRVRGDGVRHAELPRPGRAAARARVGA